MKLILLLFFEKVIFIILMYFQVKEIIFRFLIKNK